MASRDDPGARADGRRLGVYVHVPFCVRKCPYCAFASIPDRRLSGDWLEALAVEASVVLAHRPVVDTVYVGGGTPSALDSASLARLFNIVRRWTSVAAGAEITVEVNPADVTAELCASMVSLGVTRVSLGVQSFDDRVLRVLGRRHDARGAEGAISRLRSSGPPALSIDLIYGVPGQSRARWLGSLRRATACAPEHLSCYMLTVEPGTPLAGAVAAGEARAPNEALLARRFRDTSAWLFERGYEHYEVSSFALGGAHRSRHNAKYWRHEPYLGLGPAAHSLLQRERWWNVPSVREYVARVRNGETAVHGRETLDDAAWRLEAVALGLRTSDGIASRLVADREPSIGSFVERGWLVRRGTRIVPTREGMLFADRMAVELG